MEEEDVSNESNPSMGPVDELGEFASGSSDAEAGAEEYAPVASGAGDDASDALDATIGGVEFPVDAFARVAEGLNRHASWTVYPASLAECLTAAIEITSTGDIAAERRCAPAAASPPRPPPPPATRARDRRARSRARERGGAPRQIFFPFPRSVVPDRRGLSNDSNPASVSDRAPNPAYTSRPRSIPRLSAQFERAPPAVPRARPQHVRKVHHVRGPDRLGRAHPRRHIKGGVLARRACRPEALPRRPLRLRRRGR